MAVEWLGEATLDILAKFPLYDYFNCLFCSIVFK